MVEGRGIQPMPRTTLSSCQVAAKCNSEDSEGPPEFPAISLVCNLGGCCSKPFPTRIGNRDLQAAAPVHY